MTYSHEQVLHGAEGVWASGGLVAVWMGGRTLNLYRDEGDGEWASATTKQFMDQPERSEVAEAACRELGRPVEGDA